MEAVVEEMHQYYRPRQAPQTLEELDKLILHIQELQEVSAFYFSHRTQLAQISAEIKAVQINMLKENNTLWRNIFNNLRLAGLIKNEEYPRQFEHLIKAITMVTIYWSEHSKLEAESSDEIVELKNCVWGIIIPILTSEGRKIFERDIAVKK